MEFQDKAVIHYSRHNLKEQSHIFEKDRNILRVLIFGGSGGETLERIEMVKAILRGMGDEAASYAYRSFISHLSSYGFPFSTVTMQALWRPLDRSKPTETGATCLKLTVNRIIRKHTVTTRANHQP